jgi:hypothetical protein
MLPQFRRPLLLLALFALLAPATAAAATAGSPVPPLERRLFALLDQGDRMARPQARRLPDGRLLISYRTTPGAPPPSAAELREMVRNPPTYARERQVIRDLLDRLRRLGVKVELQSPSHALAAGEWTPREARLRIRPDIPLRGSAALAMVLNHESIHVAQSCRGGGVRSEPASLGLPRRVDPDGKAMLTAPAYRNAPLRARWLEQEAYAHQNDLDLGAALLDRHCGTGSAAAPARLER